MPFVQKGEEILLGDGLADDPRLTVHFCPFCGEHGWPDRGDRPCKCGVMDSIVKDYPRLMELDTEMNEFHILHAQNGKLQVYYCFACGGNPPQSLRETFFEAPTDSEYDEAWARVKSLNDEEDYVREFGDPVHVVEIPPSPEKDIQIYRQFEGDGGAAIGDLKVRAMIPRLLFTFFIACGASAGPRPGNALECHFDKTYALIAATDLRALLELRTYEKDKVIDSVVLSSRYMPPEFEARFLVSEDKPQFIIRTRDGGTGFAETHCAIYGVAGDHIRKLGDFVLERSAQSWPDSDYSEKLSGRVSFPHMGMVTYHYKQKVTKKGKTTTKSVTERFSFNPKRMQYEKAEKH